MDFEALPHTADLQIRVYGRTYQELFCHALRGMFQSIGPKNSQCKKEGDRLVCPKLTRLHEIELSASIYEQLLVDFLSEALYLSDVHDEAYLDANIHSIDAHHIKATLQGVPVTGFEVVEIKAVTYHGLEIKKVNDRYQVDIVFDI